MSSRDVHGCLARLSLSLSLLCTGLTVLHYSCIVLYLPGPCRPMAFKAVADGSDPEGNKG